MRGETSMQPSCWLTLDALESHSLRLGEVRGRVGYVYGVELRMMSVFGVDL